MHQRKLNATPSFHEIPADAQFSSILVPTIVTEQLEYVLGVLVKESHPILLIGPTGTGKSALINKLLTNVAFALRRIGARCTESQLNEMFELLGEDQDDPDSNDEIVYEDLIIAMHRDDHLVDRVSVWRINNLSDNSCNYRWNNLY